jgi:flagellar protein FliO/FliZ
VAKRLFLIIISIILVNIPIYSQDNSSNETGAPVTEVESTEAIDESQILLEDEPDDPASNNETTPDLNSFTIWDFLRMIVVLGIVIGAIYGVFFILKKSAGPKTQNEEIINIVSSQILSGNRFLHLVEIGNQMFLLGSGDNSVNLISEINEKETVDTIRLKMTENKGPQKKNFREIVSDLLNRGRKFPNEDRSMMGMEQSLDFIKQQRDRVKKLK